MTKKNTHHQSSGSRPVYGRDFQPSAGRARRGRLDYGWERLYEGEGAGWERRPAYGWERPGPWWQRGYGVGRPYYGWGQELGERENAIHSGPYAGRGPKRYGRRDNFIYEDVCEALTRHPGVDASEIEVHVSEGIVTLAGVVDSRQAKRAAEDALDTVPGIKDVDNRLRVRAYQPRNM